MRVVAYDDVEVMYDVWWQHKSAWAMASLLGDFAYFRMPRHSVQTEARFVRVDPLTDRELQVHRPDLPFAVARHAGLSWYDRSWPKHALGTHAVLNIARIYLAPFGPRDSAKPSALIEADNGESFTEFELLVKAKRLQDQFIGDVALTDGLGIYRAGIKKRTPSFYIWGSKSRAEAPSRVVSHAAKRV